MDRALCLAALALLVLSACTATEAGNMHAPVPGALPEGTSVATFVLPSVTPEGWTGTALREMPLDVYVRPVGNALAASFAGPPRVMIGPQDRNPVEGVDGAFTIDLGRHYGWCERVPLVDRVSAVDGFHGARSVFTATLRPTDDDGDGVADELCASLDGDATTGTCSAERNGTWTHEGCASLRPLEPGTAELVTPTVAPGEAVAVRFAHPMTVTSARFVKPDGTSAMAYSPAGSMCEDYDDARDTWLVTDELLPWGATVSYEIEGELAVLGGQPVTATGTLQVTAPVGAWTTSFEDGGLEGILVRQGTAEAADETSGVPPLDGARFVLVNAPSFRSTRLLFEVQVPAAPAGTLAVDARFVYRSDPGTDLPALPSVGFEVFAQGSRGGTDQAFDPTVAVPLDGGWYGATGTVTARMDLEAFAGQTVVAAIHVLPWADTCGAPPPDGMLQLDGLRLEP
jgi:hypothetical protein